MTDHAAAPELLWFMDSAIAVHLAQDANAAGASLLEHRLPEGFSPPLHVHHGEDETFFALAGRFRFEAGGVAREVGAGGVVHIPAGVVHSFRVLSPEGGRCLTLTHGGFEQMVRAASRLAANDGLPPRAEATPAMQSRLAELCAANGIDLLGPPLAA